MRGRWRETAAGWSFVAPNVLLLVLFLFLPLAGTFMLSFQEASSFGDTSWVGVENYRRLLGDEVFWRVLFNTAVFTAVDRESTRLNPSHANISYAAFCFKKKKIILY